VVDVDPIMTLTRLSQLPGREGRLTHLERVPAREAVYAEWPDWIAPEVRAAYARQGIDHLWAHQVEAADAATAGVHVVISTGTASGKSVAYQAPALSSLSQKSGFGAMPYPIATPKSMSRLAPRGSSTVS